MRACGGCGGTQRELDGASGITFCPACGTVLEENAIVAEVSFLESAGGAAVAQGALISANNQSRATGGMYGNRGGTSREITLRNAKQIITRIAQALNISRENLIESAHQLFHMAFVHQLTRGQRVERMCSACLYIACRREKTPVMLIDFADVLQVSVFRLGVLYVKLIHELHLENLELLDPSIYISRFASMMEFGDRTHDVANDALRLVRRMNTDWITTGRRPAGICGACLLIAARMHNFKRTVKEIVQVVKMAEVTINKRLNEFQATQSAGLTVDEFRDTWLTFETNPPAFERNRRMEPKKPDMLLNLNAEKPLISEKSLSKTLAPNEGALVLMSEEEVEKLEDDITQYLATDTLRTVNDTLKAKAIEQPICKNGNTLYLTPPDSQFQAIAGTNTLLERPRRDSNASTDSHPIMFELDENEHLSDLDDDEDVFGVIVSPEEAEIRSAIWHELNRDYLIEAAYRQLRKSQPKKPTRQRKRKPLSTEGPALTTAEAARRMADKKLSTKINRDHLGRMFDEDDSERIRRRSATMPTASPHLTRHRSASISSAASVSSIASVSSTHRKGRLTSILDRRRNHTLATEYTA